jgi:type III restriction enzyme
MELHSYQQLILDDLTGFLVLVESFGNLQQAFERFWLDKGVVRPEKYRNIIPQVPHVCLKVPTGGGKTFIATNAIRTIFDGLEIYLREEPKVVVWLVPSNAILEQTYRNLDNSQHPYRQKLNTLFNGRVEVYGKDDLLQGANFNVSSVREQLNVFVLSYASFRTSNKEGRKAYQENSNLDGFIRSISDEDVLPETDESALINVIRSMRPVCIVDESHNAGSSLSKEMLTNFNPSFILDLTATPRKESNILSYVDAAQLKENNMVKLPVIAYNHHSQKEVINSAIQLRNKLEAQAIEEEKEGGDYIRPIVLFQAEPETREDSTTFAHIRERLVKLGIPEEQIAIKTATINELKNVPLLARTCPIRYIITINALKEGWDCPFAYVLATIANRHSSIDVEQVVGRVLRQPYARKHQRNLLNNAFVLASSAHFISTLDKIVEGLNLAGFSRKDLRAKDAAELQGDLTGEEAKAQQQDFFQQLKETAVDPESVDQEQPSPGHDDTGPIESDWQPEAICGVLQQIEEITDEANQEYEKRTKDAGGFELPEEVRGRMDEYPMEAVFAEEGKKLRLPEFYTQPLGLTLFDDEVRVNKELFLEAFRLSQCDSQIDFTAMDGDAYRIDIEKVAEDDYKPGFWKLKSGVREQLAEFILSRPKESQVRELTGRMCQLIGNMYPIADQEIKVYVERIFSSMSVEQLRDCVEREYSYRDKIKGKINALAVEHAEKIFGDWLAGDRLVVKESYKLSVCIHPTDTAPSIPKSLYAHEGGMNNLEIKAINDIANLDNVLFWHKIVERKGFCLNGFINHYPDFLVQTKNGKTLLIETKGDDRDNSDSERKLKLGKAWAGKAGNQYRYFMVFDKNPIEGAYRLDEFVSIIDSL